MTNQLSKSTRGRLFSIKLARGGTMDAAIAHVLDVRDKIIACIAACHERGEAAVQVAALESMLE
nr:hypothetical protein [Candidatus Sigynarchaeum springense]